MIDYKNKQLFDKAEFLELLDKEWSERKGLSYMDIKVLLEVKTTTYDPVRDLRIWADKNVKVKGTPLGISRKYPPLEVLLREVGIE